MSDHAAPLTPTPRADFFDGGSPLRSKSGEQCETGEARDLLHAALWYAEHGVPVFPVHRVHGGQCSCGNVECKHPGKHPRTQHGFKDATKDADQIRNWWTRWPDANIGIPTGTASGLLALDIDPRNGGNESWRSLTLHHEPLPPTAEQLTGGGGQHLVFQDPGVPVPKELAPGIDMKSKGGYIIVAPSIHPSGQHYKWNGAGGVEALSNVAPVPSWLLAAIATARKKPRAKRPADGEKWRPGERNEKLTSYAGKLRRRGDSRESIEAALLAENQRRCEPPLSDAEVQAIAKSVASYEPAKKSKSRNAAPPSSTAFHVTESAVVYVDADPDKEPFKVCGPLEVAAFTRDEKGDCWGRLLRWPDAEGRIHEWPMPMSLLAGDGNEYRARLLDGGLIISPGRKARDLLTTYIQTAPIKVCRLCVSQIGWQGNSFVLPNATIGTNGEEAAIFQTAHESDHAFNVAGTLDDWKENVGRFCSGNSRLIFAVSCAFAGPVLALAGAESGGVHFVGLSSTGKSTMLYVGGSVLGGGGRTGAVQSWRATANGLEAVADLHNDLTLFLDELSQLDPREAAEVAYLLANGRGKSRMGRSIMLRKRSKWCLLFVSAGEINLADHAQTVGKRVRAGAEVRLLTIDSDGGAGTGVFENIHGAKSPDDFARQMTRSALRFYGTPLLAFLDLLTAERPDAERALKNFVADFVNKHVNKGSSGEVFRAAQRVALIAAAGEMATDAGITGWEPGEPTDAAVRCLHSWLSRRGTTGSADAVGIISQVRRFLEAHGPSRFQAVRHSSSGAGEGDRDDAQPIRDRAGFRRRNADTDETEYLILQETFKSEVCAGYDYRHVCRVLEEGNYLDREKPHWTIKPRQLPEMPKGTRVYCVRATILEDAE